MYFYNVVSTIPFDKVSNKILKQVSMAATIAEESDFDYSKRLGASLEYKGYYFYGSNSHRNRVGKIDCIYNLSSKTISIYINEINFFKCINPYL